MVKKAAKGLMYLIMLFIGAFVVVYTFQTDNIPEPENVVEATVTRVVDGDTFVVDIDGEEERLRLIGVDCPESVHPDESRNTEAGVIASEYSKEHIPAGELVYLEYGEDPRDDYDRLLAYMYMDKELSQMYNEQLLAAGMAKVMTIEPNDKYASLFSEIEMKARHDEVGIWKDAA